MSPTTTTLPTTVTYLFLPDDGIMDVSRSPAKSRPTYEGQLDGSFKKPTLSSSPSVAVTTKQKRERQQQFCGEDVAGYMAVVMVMEPWNAVSLGLASLKPVINIYLSSNRRCTSTYGLNFLEAFNTYALKPKPDDEEFNILNHIEEFNLPPGHFTKEESGTNHSFCK
ncbi:hypothetical protein M8C21_007861 [Ambrosia artemisiifolia]|uniref:Uncharacterized protein n=1 Tax=Ambrosia artemisiifolia TaxID=4212 RepID=A0AAD5CME5_AMBAR|nr:hypothetical protein M8C21_007861 [Ambrosia artemisiifolia]